MAIPRSFQEATRGMDITPPRFAAPVVIGANAGLSQTALGNVLGIARSWTTQLTDWFEERELVERRQSPDDARAWGLHLTPRGEKLAARLKQRVADEERKLAAVLSDAERRTVLRLLGKLAG